MSMLFQGSTFVGNSDKHLGDILRMIFREREEDELVKAPELELQLGRLDRSRQIT